MLFAQYDTFVCFFFISFWTHFTLFAFAFQCARSHAAFIVVAILLFCLNKIHISHSIIRGERKKNVFCAVYLKAYDWKRCKWDRSTKRCAVWMCRKKSFTNWNRYICIAISVYSYIAFIIKLNVYDFHLFIFLGIKFWIASHLCCHEWNFVTDNSSMSA